MLIHPTRKSYFFSLQEYTDTHTSLFQNWCRLFKNILFDAGIAFLGSITATYKQYIHKQYVERNGKYATRLYPTFWVKVLPRYFLTSQSGWSSRNRSDVHTGLETVVSVCYGSSCTGVCPPACCPGSSWGSRACCSPWTREGMAPVWPWCLFTRHTWRKRTRAHTTALQWSHLTTEIVN